VGERIQLRRRLRRQRQAREAMLLDLGALVYELHRQGRRAPELLQQKAAELEIVDGEVRELEDRLAGLEPQSEAGWGAGGAPGDGVGEEALGAEALHEDFDELDEEEPDAGELDEDEREDDLDDEEPAGEVEDEPGEDDFAEDDFAEYDFGDEGELEEDEGELEEDEGELAAEGDELGEDDELYEDAPDADATVEVDALDGVPDDREARP
jgi:hypothetical protein